jgi:hypothetical protein
LGIFLFTTMSSTDLGPIQPPIQWVPGALSLGVKWLGCEADHSSPSSAEVKECVELYLHSPNTPSWRGDQLKKAQGQLYLYLNFLFKKALTVLHGPLAYPTGLLDLHIETSPWPEDQPDARPLPTEDNTTQKHMDTHPCPKQDSNM